MKGVRAVIALLFFTFAATAADRLYLKDGSYQLTNQYEIKTDRVRYFSSERSEWEEIPLELVDLDRTQGELTQQKARATEEAKADAEERVAELAAQKEVSNLPATPGVYYIHGDKVEPVKVAESKIVNDKKRSILKALSPIPLVPGKSTVELDGEHAPLHISENRPEFYFRLSDFERLEMVKLTPKKEARVVMFLSILKIQDERMVDEKLDKIETFKKQEGELLYKIWPEKPLAPGEYAVIEYTEGKTNPQIWDFSVSAK